ncbi:MAG TPA: hypothetical protein VFC46_12885 [Humisphaera sp.]|nr:hypothetical protein [Humisphaera sp.]
MQLGFVSAIFPDLDLDQVLQFAADSDLGFREFGVYNSRSPMVNS